MTKTHSPDLTIFTTDSANILFVYVLMFITLFYAQRVPQANMLAFSLLMVASVYMVFMKISNQMRNEHISFSIRVICIIAFVSFLFQAVAPLQFIFYDDWFDSTLVSIEHQLIGTECAYYSQQFVNPILTEWMMFAYVIYIPLLPVIAILCYRYTGRHAGELYLLNLTTAYIFCYTGFIIFPIASPLYYSPELFTVPLDGGIFTWCAEWIRQNQHYPGGSLPSPHSAAATIMLVCIYRYARRYFYLILPVTITIYFATVYGRFHYLWDSIAGIIVALLSFKITPVLTSSAAKLWMLLTHPRSRAIPFLYSDFKNGGVR